MRKSDKQNQLTTLDWRIRRCRKCPLCKSRFHAVPGEGPANARIFFLGEAPGKGEDLQGKPFVGRSGKFLNYLLEKSGFVRNEIYITSSVKCRPPKNRNPRPNELKICKQNWLNKQIEIINPKIIVLLGKVALKQVLGASSKLDKFHGRLIRHNGLSCFPTYHPAAAMRFSKLKKNILKDLIKLKRLAKIL